MTVFAMLRPRGGGDFHYSDLEMDCILADIHYLKDAGADGFVFGALDQDRRIDERNCQKVVDVAGSLPVTFHRAFDVTMKSDLIENVHLVQSIGFKRLLTSGLALSAMDGIKTIRTINNEANNLIVMPGAGINVRNAGLILEQSGCQEFHSSGRSAATAPVASLINGIDFGRCQPTNRETVRQLVDIAKVVKMYS